MMKLPRPVPALLALILPASAGLTTPACVNPMPRTPPIGKSNFVENTWSFINLLANTPQFTHMHRSLRDSTKLLFSVLSAIENNDINNINSNSLSYFPVGAATELYTHVVERKIHCWPEPKHLAFYLVQMRDLNIKGRVESYSQPGVKKTTPDFNTNLNAEPVVREGLATLLEFRKQMMQRDSETAGMKFGRQPNGILSNMQRDIGAGEMVTEGFGNVQDGGGRGYNNQNQPPRNNYQGYGSAPFMSYMNTLGKNRTTPQLPLGSFKQSLGFQPPPDPIPTNPNPAPLNNNIPGSPITITDDDENNVNEEEAGLMEVENSPPEQGGEGEGKQLRKRAGEDILLNGGSTKDKKLPIIYSDPLRRLQGAIENFWSPVFDLLNSREYLGLTHDQVKPVWQVALQWREYGDTVDKVFDVLRVWQKDKDVKKRVYTVEELESKFDYLLTAMTLGRRVTTRPQPHEVEVEE